MLNEVLTSELTSVNQYFLDAKMLGNWGYERLAEKYRAESIDEMKDADDLDRADPVPRGDAQPAAPLAPCASARQSPEKLQAALDLEYEAIARLNRGIELCVGKSDNGTRELLEHILEGEEEFADWLETQLELIRQVGEAHYLAQQIHD